MQLTVTERMLLLTHLPEQGDVTALKLVRKLKESLSFSEEEHKLLGFRWGWKCPKCSQEIMSPEPIACGQCNVQMRNTGEVQWKTEADPKKDVHIGDKMTSLVVAELKRLNREKKLTDNMVELYEKFVGKLEVEDD